MVLFDLKSNFPWLFNKVFLHVREFSTMHTWLPRQITYPTTLFLITLLFCTISVTIVFAEQQKTVAYIGFSTDKPFWVNLGKAVRQEAARRNINLIDLTPPSPDIETQTKLLEHAIEKQVAGIILGASDPSPLHRALSKAVKRGIPVIAIDTAIEHPAVKSLVATDNAKGAALAGAYIVEKTGGKGSVLILGGTKDHPNGDLRRFGVTRKAEAAGMKVIFRQADWDDAKAFVATSEELEKENDISAIFACWDPGIDMASHVVARMGLKNNLVMVGFDGLERTLDNIEQGKVSATIAQDTDTMGKTSVEALVTIMSGESYATVTLIPPFLVDRDSLKQSR
jgi:ABC-type sugar transport system substrate-binding protein